MNKFVIPPKVYSEGLSFKGVIYVTIQPGNFYFIDDSFFSKVNDKYLKCNYQTTKRPHYFPFMDENTNLLWLVPCSSKVDKFKNIIQKREQQGKKTKSIKIIKLQNKETVLLFQDMFPISSKYIADQYIRNNQPVKISNPKILKELEKTAKEVIVMIRKGVKFTPTQPNALAIEKIMLQEQLLKKTGMFSEQITKLSERNIPFQCIKIADDNYTIVFHSSELDRINSILFPKQQFKPKK